MEINKKTIVIVGSILITIIIVVGSIVTITRINKNKEDTPSKPQTELSANQEIENNKVEYSIYEEVNKRLEEEESSRIKEVIETDEDTGEILGVTESGETAVIQKPQDIPSDYEGLSEDELLQNVLNIVNQPSQPQDNTQDTTPTTPEQPIKNDEPAQGPVENNSTDNSANQDLINSMFGDFEDQAGQGGSDGGVNSDVTFG